LPLAASQNLQGLKIGQEENVGREHSNEIVPAKNDRFHETLFVASNAIPGTYAERTHPIVFMCPVVASA
jgi:hypothetical protein